MNKLKEKKVSVFLGEEIPTGQTNEWIQSTKRKEENLLDPLDCLPPNSPHYCWSHCVQQMETSASTDAPASR